MAGYQPLKITGNSTGLVQGREDFLLPNDAYPTLQNAYIWREQIRRKQGCLLLGRLQRDLTAQSLGNTDGSGALTGSIKTILSLEATGQIKPKSLVITIGAQVFTDAGDGNLSNGLGGTGTINYSTMAITFQTAPVLATTAITAAFSYFPGLPEMGLRSRQIASTNRSPTIAFDTKYAYQYPSVAWSEWIPGTTWSGSDSQFFWTTNYWTSHNATSVFWATNFNITDPIRYTDGTAWQWFAPQVDNTPHYLQGCLALLPFRGRLLAFNTIEGTNDFTTPPFTGSITYPQRIRWSAVGTPFSVISSPSTMITVAEVNPNAWRDDIRGQGGFINIPTSEAITAVGFVRDNLVVYCERSTWQIRYSQNSVAPFSIERVNSELGAGSLLSAVEFDTSLVGIGDKGVIECNSYESVRIDPQIPDLVFKFNQSNNGSQRISGVRDFINKLAFWTYPYVSNNEFGNTFPNYRLVYNYDNKSWATFTDSYTCLGTFQPLGSFTWAQAKQSWQTANYSWIGKLSGELDIVGGNQQGYVEYLDSLTSNDVSLAITAITSDNISPTKITVVNHNLQEGAIIQIKDIPIGTGYASLNNGIFYVNPTSNDQLDLWVYNPITDDFDTPQLDQSQTFVGYGQIAIRDNFFVQSKKFNFMDDGQNIQLGYVDVLTNKTSSGGISLNIYLDYNDSTPINTLTQNQNPTTNQPDTFFNTVVPTSQSAGVIGNKYWHRVFCPVRGAFITLVWTLSNAQLVGIEQQSDVQIDAQILWLRKAGRLQTANI
jgi:hypothetical protein